MKRTSLLVVLAAGIALATMAACGPRSADQRGQNQAVLIIECQVADAAVWVDGRYIAEVRDLPNGLAMPPGRHQIQVRSDHHFAHYREIELAPRQRLRIQVTLAERLP